MTPANLRVAIIGAGPAGLTTARATHRAGYDVVVFERNAGVGGIWDIDAPGSPMYRSAHFISSCSQWTSHFSGHPFPDGTPAYPSQRQVHDYLVSFADKEGLTPLIRFNTGVTLATPDQNGGWNVSTADYVEAFDAIIVCTGTLWDATLPDLQGTFTGVIRHSQTYRDPEEFKNKKVLILGAGNSGVDIACDAARTADRAFLSLRRGYWFLPKFIMGRPTDAFFRDSASMPDWLSPPDFESFLTAISGDPALFGLPKPDHAPLSSHPIMNSEVLQHLGHGRLAARGDIAHMDANKVTFASGEVEDIDEIICATGYRASVPFLPAGLLDYRGGSRPRLKATAFHPTAQNLYFNGMIETNGGVFGLFDRLGSVISRLIGMKASGALNEVTFQQLTDEADSLSNTKGKISSSRHLGYVDTRNFLTALDHLDARTQVTA